MSKKTLYLTAAIAVTVFIFSNSMLPASESSEISGGLLSFLLGVLPFEISHHILRKLAHFGEFFMQGFFLRLYFSCTFSTKKTAATTAAVGFITACCDEFLQLFSEGRATSFIDILIDFSGTLSSILFLFVITAVIKSKSSD